MKLENLVFQKKAGCGAKGNNYSYPNVTISSVKSGNSCRVKISFRKCSTLYDSNIFCVYAIAGNRIYFMFCGESDCAYKLYKPKAMRSDFRFMCVQGNKELSKFVRDNEYTPKLDSECGLWYIEY